MELFGFITVVAGAIWMIGSDAPTWAWGLAIVIVGVAMTNTQRH